MYDTFQLFLNFWPRLVRRPGMALERFLSRLQTRVVLSAVWEWEPPQGVSYCAWEQGGALFARMETSEAGLVFSINPELSRSTVHRCLDRLALVLILLYGQPAEPGSQLDRTLAGAGAVFEAGVNR